MGKGMWAVRHGRREISGFFSQESGVWAEMAAVMQDLVVTLAWTRPPNPHTQGGQGLPGTGEQSICISDRKERIKCQNSA